MSSNFFKAIHDSNRNGVAYKNIKLKKQILAHFASHQTATIAELSNLFNISIPKINECILELINDELVKDYGKTTSTVGRKPNTYGLVPNSAYYVGVQVALDYLSITMINMKKEIIASEIISTFKLENNEASLQIICEETKNFIQEKQIDKKQNFRRRHQFVWSN